MAGQKSNGSIDFVLGSTDNTNAGPRPGKALGDPKVNAAGASYNEDRMIGKINVKRQGCFGATWRKTDGWRLSSS
jgi:hypothetical protein